MGWGIDTESAMFQDENQGQFSVGLRVRGPWPWSEIASLCNSRPYTGITIYPLFRAMKRSVFSIALPSKRDTT